MTLQLRFNKNPPFLFILIMLFSLQAASQGYVLQNRFTEASSQINIMATNPAKNLLVCGDEKGVLYFRNLNDGVLQKSLSAHGNSVNTINFNSTGDLMISSTVDGEIKIYDFEKNKIIQGIYSPDYHGISFVLFSIADGFIYFNSKNKLYKTRSDLTQQVMMISEYDDSLRAAVITTDRNSLIIATGNKLKVLNTRSDQLRQEISAGFSAVEHLILLGDTMLASWSADGVIQFWPYKYGQLAVEPIHWFRAGTPSRMNFSADASLMISGNTGNWARVWNPFNKSIKQELYGHEGKVNCSVFGADENVLYTGSSDHSVIQWKYIEDSVPQQTLQTPPISKQNIDSIKTSVVVKSADTTNISSDVIMSHENIPATIQGRKVLGSEKVEINTSSTTIFVYDNSYIDGDTMSLFFNGKWILDHYGVTKKKHPIQLHFKPNTNNYLVLFANNLGKSPPNTAAVEVYDGKTKRIFKLSSDLKSCSAINFIYKPEN